MRPVSLADRDPAHARATNPLDSFDHPDAPATDLAEAARQLRAATAHDYARHLATPAPKKKQQKGGDGGGKGGGGSGSGKAGGGGDSDGVPPFFDFPPLP